MFSSLKRNQFTQLGVLESGFEPKSICYLTLSGHTFLTIPHYFLIKGTGAWDRT